MNSNLEEYVRSSERLIGNTGTGRTDYTTDFDVNHTKYIDMYNNINNDVETIIGRLNTDSSVIKDIVNKNIEYPTLPHEIAIDEEAGSVRREKDVKEQIKYSYLNIAGSITTLGLLSMFYYIRYRR
jgi:hypothetical protein